MESIHPFRVATFGESLTSLQESVRRDPADPSSRLALFQLSCVQGNWPRARAQLAALRVLGDDWSKYSSGYDAVLACEQFRGEVFSGTRPPLIYGESSAWMAAAGHALRLAVQENWAAAAEERARAWAEAPAVGGRLNDSVSFEWIADADSRLGPILEGFIDGKYYWVPLPHLERVVFAPPVEVLDLVWCRAGFTWRDGGKSDGLIPVRYAGTEAQADDALRWSRATHWREAPGETFLGLGQRLLASSAGEHALLDVRRIDFLPATGTSSHG